MILYTVVPNEVIFNSDQEFGQINQVEIEYLNEKVQAHKDENGNLIIQRICSTLPKAYLNKELSPGTMIRK